MPVASEISIRHVSNSFSDTSDGDDITEHVLFSTARFETISGGGSGQFSFSLKDPARNLSWAWDDQINTGDQIRLYIDDVLLFGGFIQQVGRTFAFPAVDTTLLSNVTSRYFTVRGSNYNMLFDRLVVRRPAAYLMALPVEPGSTQAGVIVKKMCSQYLDFPDGFTAGAYVDDVGRIQPFDADWPFVNGGEQGRTFREEMEWIRRYNSAIYYFDAHKRLHFHAPEKVFAPWGFSDRPNKRSVLTSHTTFSGATYGFRELDTTQDLTSIVNDIFVWGGSPFQATTSELDPSGTLFARRQNTVSQEAYGRWQMAEVGFGVESLKTQSGVDSRAEVIVPPNNSDIPPGINEEGIIRNRSKPGWTAKLAWYAHDVPTMNNGVKRHLVPGEIVTIILYVHGAGLSKPLILTLPLRRMSMSFPTLPNTLGSSTPETFVRFDGDFGLDLNDPHQLWDAILDQRTNIARIVGIAGNPTATGSPGAVWQGQPDEAPNGTRKTFTLSSSGDPIAYAALSSEVFVGGLLLRQGADYQEGPSNGTLTLFTAPPTGAIFWVRVRLAG